MSKRRRTNPGNKFVMLERWFWRCPAWQALPHPARSLYVELEMLFDGQNNGSLEMGIRRAMTLLGCSFNFTRKMFAELEDKGFVKPNQRGSFSWKGGRETTWILTKHELKGQPPTAEYARWQPSKKQNPDSPRASDGRSRRVREVSETPLTDAPQESVETDSDPFTDAPGESSSSIPPASNKSERAKPETAPLSAAPCTLAAHADLRPPPRTGGPRFGQWLEQEGLRLQVPPQYVADALKIAVDDLVVMTRSARVRWTPVQRRRVVEALVNYRPN
jgi:hypothetical protein